MAKYFRFPWAVAGDRATLPDATQANGSVSYQQGYGLDYERNPATDSNARDIERQMYNQALFDITETLQQYYQRGVPNFITTTDNGGTPYPYVIYARVLFNNRVHESLINNNITDPTNTTNWRLADFGGLDLRYLTQAFADSRYLQGTLGQADGNIPQIGLPATAGRSAVVVNAGSNANGSYRIWSDGYIEQIGLILQSSTASITWTYPVPFTSIIDTIQATTAQSTNSLLTSGNFVTYGERTTITVRMRIFQSLNTPGSGSISIYAAGF